MFAVITDSLIWAVGVSPEAALVAAEQSNPNLEDAQVVQLGPRLAHRIEAGTYDPTSRWFLRISDSELLAERLAEDADIDCLHAGPSSTSDHPGAIDATLSVDGIEVDVTLLPREQDGDLDTWGSSQEYWASNNLLLILQACDDPVLLTRKIVYSVEAAR